MYITQIIICKDNMITSIYNCERNFYPVRVTIQCSLEVIHFVQYVHVTLYIDGGNIR